MTYLNKQVNKSQSRTGLICRVDWSKVMIAF